MIAANQKTVEVLGAEKDGQRYVVRFCRGQGNQVAMALGRWAGNPELDLTWRDVAQMLCRLVASRPNEVPAEMREKTL